MKLIAVYLHPEDTDDEISLNIHKVNDFSHNTVFNTIENLYDVDESTFSYYEPTPAFDGNGVFTTVEGEDIKFRWIFETREID